MGSVKFPFYDEAPKEIVSTCNLCGRNKFILQAMKDRYGLEAPTVKCVKCGLVFLALRMTAEYYRRFYEEGHYRKLFEQWLGEPYPVQRIEQDQERYAEALSRALSDSMNPYRSGLLLDVGGSTGIIADRMANDYDLDATVLEPSVIEAQRAQQRGLTVIQKAVEDYSPNGNRYDVVLLCRSVEHFLDPSGALKRIRATTRKGGLLFVDFVRPELKPKIDHPYYPNIVTMGALLWKAGFRAKRWYPGLDQRHLSILAEAV